MREIERFVGSRRNFIKRAAIGATAASALPIVQAKEKRSSSEIYKQALKVQEETGDRAKFRKYLRNHGMSVATNDMTISVPVDSGTESGLSTQKLDKNDLEIGISLSTGCYHDEFYSKVTWNWGNNDWDDYGDDPKDNIAMSWKENSWYVPADQAWGSSYIANANDYDYSANGISMRYSDGKDMGLPGDTSGERWIAATLKKPSDEYNAGARQVWGVYNHCYAGGAIKSVSIGFGIVSATFDTSAKQWYKGTDENGNKLILSEADATVNCSGL